MKKIFYAKLLKKMVVLACLVPFSSFGNEIEQIASNDNINLQDIYKKIAYPGP